MLLAAAAVLSCVKEELKQEEGNDPVVQEEETLQGIVASAQDFDILTKTSVSTSGKFSWKEGDVIGVVPTDEKTYQTNFEVKTVGEDPKNASFDGGAWKLRDGDEYAAYYPCKDEVVTSAASVEFDMNGQSQSGNNSLDHFGAYDIMFAAPVIPQDGNVTFNFKHKVSLVKITIPVTVSGTYTALSLKAEKACFPRKASMSLSDGTTSTTNVSDQLELALDKISLSKGEELIAWMSVLPTKAMESSKLSVVLTTTDGDNVSYDVRYTASEFLAGKAYSLEAERESKALFRDDFSWLSPFITDGCADFVNGTYPDLQTRINTGNNNSVNLHNTYPDTFPAALAAAGYADEKASNKTIYGQGTAKNPYLKFCKNNTQTAISFRPFKTSYDKATISLDWAEHMTMSALDVVSFQLRIEGAGVFANGTKESQLFTAIQEAGKDPVWSHITVPVSSVNSTTKISISSKEAFDNSYAAAGQHRFYIDNLVVSTEVEGYDEDPVVPASGSTVYGVVKCGDEPIKDVVVSDGYEVVTTDINGVYQLKSAKKNKYVFISIPSGYEVASNGVLPLFHQKLTKAASTVERVDFELFDAGDQTKHTILYLADMHLANRTNDRNQFRVFTNEIAAYRRDHPDEKLYAITQGDMTWDLYWYSRNYCFEQYLNEYKGVVSGLQIFHTIGNHDHDMNATGDWDTVLKFRDDICPNYYSFNIGQIHYVVMDDIECTNSPASTTDGAGRSYNEKVVSDVLSWLKKDLSHVSKATPIVVSMHAPVYNKDGGNSMDNASELTTALSGYNVTFVTGHTHRLYTVDKSSSIREYNNGAVCAAWWWAGKYNSNYNIATDGAPSGYRVMSVNGTSQNSYFKATGRPATYQFRAYDRNQINLDLSMVPSGAQSNFQKELLASLIYGNYQGGSSANEVLINVWDWNSKWKIEVTENGKAVSVSQKTLIDPSFYIAYTIPHMNAGNNSVTWHPAATNNFFVAKASSDSSTLTIKVTDDEGRVYTQQMTRPMAFTVANCAQ